MDGLSFRWPLLTVVVFFALELVLILRLNDGVFVFLFDDAYLLFEQARNIWSGIYGFNPGEISAPCSSILWPFILAPLTALPFFEWAVLGLNLGIVIAIIGIQHNILFAAYFRLPKALKTRRGKVFVNTLLALLVFINSLILMVFIGMETPLQMLLTLLVLFGLIHETRTGRIHPLLMIGLLFAPLIRYECLAIVCPAVIYLFVRGHRVKALFAGLGVVMTLGVFSLYLYAHDIGFLPTSIAAKTVHQNGSINPASNIGVNLVENFTNPFCLPLVLLIFSLLPAAVVRRYRSFHGPALVLVSGGLLYMVFGHVSPLPIFRYEAYILAALTVGTLYFYLSDMLAFLHRRVSRKRWPVAFLGIPLLLLLVSSLVTTGLIPYISNWIYRHHYQMHRLVTEYYPQPVAVNDFGLVSYQNASYVLDLWGAGSKDALQCGLEKNSLECVAELARHKEVHLVMVTNSWFNRLPGEWLKIGAYYPGKNPRLMEPFASSIINYIDFYVTDTRYLEDVVKAIKQFRRTLPPTAEFRFNPFIVPEDDSEFTNHAQ